jgi:hypothetical protein
LPTLVSVFMVFAPLSASTCDLTCWLHYTASDCHSDSLATEGHQKMMPASSEMEMSSDPEMSSHVTQSNARPSYSVNAIAHHSMSAQMDMVRRSLQVIQKSDAGSNTGFDHSKRLSPCSHDTCSQASASGSPPRASRTRPAHRHDLIIHISNPSDLLTSSHRVASGAPPPINLEVDLLPTLRI